MTDAEYEDLTARIVELGIEINALKKAKREEDDRRATEQCPYIVGDEVEALRWNTDKPTGKVYCITSIQASNGTKSYRLWGYRVLRNGGLGKQGAEIWEDVRKVGHRDLGSPSAPTEGAN